LEKAQKRLAEGDWQDAIRDCRLALEPFFEKKEVIGPDGKTRDVPILKRSWETRLGNATYDWLNASFGAIKDPGNRATHTIGAFDEITAQMLLTVTTALVAYAARALK